MHIPDGFLDLKTAAATGSAAAVCLWAALRHAKQSVPERDVPLLGLSGAFIFAAQMINFPVVGGTSGHLVGSLLLAALLGPSAAIVVMTSVLIVQCLLFADGGVTALGANVLNMAAIGAGLAWLVYRALRAVFPGRFGLVLAAAFGGWSSTVFAAAGCSIELAASGLAPASAVMPAMIAVHMLIGVGEGAITALVLYSVSIRHPELLGVSAAHSQQRIRSRRVLVGALTLAIMIALLLSPAASKSPDGLEYAAESLGFAGRGYSVVDAFFPEHSDGTQFFGRAVSIAGAVGTVFAFALSWLLALFMTKGTAPDGVS